jgi:hypothetical protein
MFTQAEMRSADGLARKVWEFDLRGQFLVLTRYAEETRQSKRHKWRGPQWLSHDERSYCSALSRPTAIPDWVVKKAVRSLTFDIAIGWSNRDSVTGSVTVAECARAEEPDV